MSCFRVKTCCCCMNLAVGAKVISILAILSSIAVLVLDGLKAFSGATERYLVGVFVVAAILGILEFICSCFLAYGAFQNESWYMKPWIAFSWLKAVLMLVVGVLMLLKVGIEARGPKATRPSDTREDSFQSMGHILVAVVTVYLVCVVSSRRRQLELEEESFALRPMRPGRTDATKHIYV